MNVADAAYHVVHDAPGGSESLAPRLGMSAAVLNSKVNPKTLTHHLSLREAVAVTNMTRDFRILHAFAAECDHIVLPLPNGDDANACDAAVLEMIAAVWKGQGEVGTAVHDALADGRVDAKELRRIEAAVHRVHTCLAAFTRRIGGMAEPEPTNGG